MLALMPPYYQNSSVIAAILQAEGAQFDLLLAAMTAVNQQCYVLTATDWGLALWEAILALPPVADLNEDAIPRGLGVLTDEIGPTLTVTERQARILAWLQSAGTATTAKVESTIATYGVTALVFEDIPNYTIYVRFAGSTGVPASFTALSTALRALVPAHLAITYQYTYLTWAQLDAINGGGPDTWSQVDALNETWDTFETL